MISERQRSLLKLSIYSLLPLLILFLPLDWFPIDGLTIIEKRVIAIFFLAAIYWVFEPIPIYATSILIIVLELVMISNQAMLPFRSGSEAEHFGILMDYKEIMATFASPIILLFLGGFFLAMAATKYRLDQNLARILLKPFGKQPQWIMLGLMVITATFSMFMSNTATTAMMLSILVPVLHAFEPGDRGKVAFALCIPLAANIGGIGTPIGTPPNAIALKYLTGSNEISFGSWMSFGIPYVIILLLIAWYILKRLFPIKTPKIELNIRGRFLKNYKAIVVYITFSLTILLWLSDFIHGMNAYIVSLIPVAVFLSAQIITKEDLKRISWDVLWLVSGGIALGLALDKSGLAAHAVESIPFSSFSPYIILGFAALLAMVMANFMSNTATANLLLPIIAALGTSLSSLDSIGGGKTLILGVALSASLGMALPISTPPNALAHATGEIETKDMSRIGIIVGTLGLFLVFGLLFVLKQVNFL
ncbi:MAG: SLC13/DASS family transporter [Bacteroidetes bacterium]|nr:SLC13/DASS family transporter [Bacteroidota bacterium]